MYKMKILQIIPSLGSGGAERFVCELSEQLNEQSGIQCHVATLYSRDFNCFFRLNDQIYIKDFNKKAGPDLRCLYNVYKFIKANKYTVVHAHVNAILYILLAAFLLPRVRFVATIHSDAYFEAPSKLDRFVRKLLFKSRKVQAVTISEESNVSFKQLYRISASIIYNGVSQYLQSPAFDEVEIPDDNIVFIHPASCQPVKNQKLLFSAFQKLASKYKNVKLLWFGNNTTYPDLFTELSQYFSDQIVYCGCVDNMRDYMAKADAVCLSSLKEGMPMSIIEAFSVGCVPIVTPAGGCVNMVTHEVNGFIASSFDVDDYYNVLERYVLLSPEKLKDMKHASRKTFNKYTIRECSRRYIDVYNSNMTEKF